MSDEALQRTMKLLRRNGMLSLVLCCKSAELRVGEDAPRPWDIQALLILLQCLLRRSWLLVLPRNTKLCILILRCSLLSFESDTQISGGCQPASSFFIPFGLIYPLIHSLHVGYPNEIARIKFKEFKLYNESHNEGTRWGCVSDILCYNFLRRCCLEILLFALSRCSWRVRQVQGRCPPSFAIQHHLP